MATTTILQLISNSNVFSPLVSGVVAATVALCGQYYFFLKNRNEERYQKLYGPLIYQLLKMRLLTSNREQLTAEIMQELRDPSQRIEEMQTHGRPLVLEWIKHKESIEKLFEEYPGQIKNEDIGLVGDFLDGCIKRKITEDGKNWYTTEERTNKLMTAIQALQERFLP
ncbi:hypothetical protein A3C20_02125 [Candidatus Kaiserbacteria bacterium RIFCSPHIGHO2_02_FULL_55_25]|uniref:Uncharacterized protein n=1 Tax=Candidatus Kaiserbacteria bacterium RIFCSPHIGHO2_02_FULL_55_25 TaxID=1798498 RepID=A0A1F6E4D5_9BACT|nr:MAG: hypothetical protein A3C20_02125 [Candidatus Kaiserbacteria bacterium RIFCSPHIGHO2_02_FULL_55_25]OGG77067.1 MAG: hypothetical protein A3F56_01680 [Candidatus Kaiserbacteria bacterium RIFCSPHIGHO2_12_FULL_55_13]